MFIFLMVLVQYVSEFLKTNSTFTIRLLSVLIINKQMEVKKKSYRIFFNDLNCLGSNHCFAHVHISYLFYVHNIFCFNFLFIHYL